MSKIIGTIKAVMGQVWIVASDGSRRLATEGEQIMRGELVVTDQGAATVTLPNGKNMDLGRGSEWGDGAVAASASGGADEQAIAAAQQAIAEGADPTQILEATAAGNSTIIDSFAEPTGAHNGHSHVILDLTGEILDPTAGYPTQGLDAATIAPVEEVTLLRPELDNSSDDPITPPPPQPLPEASITIDVIAGDNVINMNEAAQEKTVISGTTGLDVHPGDIVTVTVNGNSYQTLVAADGRWSVEVNTHDLVASGEVHASVTTFDQYGNQASASAEIAVALDITAPNVSLHIDVISGDGFINTAEAAKPTTTISGTVGGDAKAGDVVHLEVNGTDYIAQVVAGEGGKLVWQTEVATSDLLAEPQVNGSITIRDAAGNEATAVDSESVVIDTTAPAVTLHIDVINDGYINANESKESTTTVKGIVGGDAKAGDIVHLEVNGTNYTATVVAGEGSALVWQTEVATSDLLADPIVNGSITIKDAAGNEATAIDDESVVIDTTAPVVTLHIDVISGDGYINAVESKELTTTVKGTVGGDAKAGDVVHLEVNGTDYIAQVVAGEGGKLVWQTEVATSDLLADPQVNGSITIRDAAGNEATAVDSESVVIDTTAPAVTLHIDVINDGYINANESKESTTTVKGIVGGDAKAGDIVHLEVNGTNYTATVVAGEGSALVWQTEVATSDLLADPIVNGSITIKDAAGNEATAIDDESVVIDTTAPVVTLHIDVISGDGYINAVESKEPTTTVKGTVGGDAKAGDVVHLEVNGTDYSAQVVAGDNGTLIWQTEVATSDLLADPEVNGSITIKDAAGNEATAIDDESVEIDTTAPVVTLHIDVISDGYINAAESKEPTTIVKGTVGGDAKAGDVVHLEVNGADYTAQVVAGENGTLVWQTEVATSDLLADPEVNGSITIKDAAGNEATAIDDESVIVDTTAPVVTLHIDVISDGYINAAEAEKPTTNISGTVGGDAKAGDVVHLEINGKDYPATVVAGEDGALVWQTKVATSDLLADPIVNGTITIKDAAGNEATAIDDETVTIDTTAPVVTLHIDVISDGYINAAESKEPTTTVKGTVGGDAKAGDVVHLEVNDKTYTAEVYADKDGKLVWQTEVATSDLLADPEVNGSITIKDAAGNEATDIDDESVIIDTTAPVVTLDIDVISGGYINAAESQEPTTTISGTVGGDAKAGDIVHLEVNGNEYTAEVYADKDGKLVWQTEVATSDLLADPEVNGSITIKDAAGNEATDIDDESVIIDTTPPVVELEIDTISGDGFINAAESKEPTTTVKGTVGGDAKAGDVVHLEVNGNEYTAEVYTDKDGKLVWQTEVATSDLLADPEVNGSITIKDAAGNEATDIDDESVIVDTTAPVVTLHIDVISDGYINAAEAEKPTTNISGTVGGDAKAGDVVHLEINGKDYPATVVAGEDGALVWQTTVATSDLLADPQVYGSITITDEAGNEATATDDESVKIDTTPPVVELEIDIISGDGFINADEAEKTTTTISGTVGGDAKAGDVVQLEVNGNKYTAEVVADKGGRLVWQTEVATSDLIADKQVNGSITITDEAGNKATAIDKETVIIDTEITVKVIIDPVTGDDFLSFAETNQLPGKSEPLIKVTGTVTGEAEAGDIVDVKVGDVTQKVTLTDDGKGNLVWKAEFTASNMMKNPEVTASISISDPAGNTASDSTSRPVTIETGNLITGDEKDNVINGGDTSDIIIADTQGFQQLPGQDYNIAFVVDSSGSVSAADIKSIVASLTTVFNALYQNAQLANSGDVKILLVDFDAQVNFAVSVNLKDSGALKTLTDALAKMTSGEGTNYEDAFKTTANWFHDVSSSSSENLTYFITDGKPTYYQSGEKTSVDVDGRSGNNNVVMLDVTKLDYHPGQSVSMNINGTSRVVIDASGNVYSWNGSTRTSVGIMRADGKGGYEISVRAGSGSSTTTDTTTNSTYAFGLLMAMCGNVEAIGINNGINASDLIAYDSDGKVTAGISASELANAILGGDYVQMAGAQDTVHGNGGNDVIFGDMLQFGDKTGYAAIQEYVAGKLNIAVNQLEVSHIAQYISEHPAEFDQSQADGGRDVLFGGVGNDILYGGGGDDILVGGSGDDVLFGGKGDDILIGDGFDSMADMASHLNTPVNQLTFDKVVDYVTQHSEELGAIGSGNDKLYGGEGNDLLMGGGGNDILNGGEGNDLMFGGTGNDVLIGGKGNDTLYGGTGSDTFTWLKGDDGHDVIKDFRADEGDRIDLSDLLGDVANTDLASYIKVTDDNHGNTVIEINTNGQMQSGNSTMSITVENCTSADIDINSLIAKPDAPVI